MRRKTYLLLELLIAFSLLALCSIPLVRNPMNVAKEELRSIVRMELERMAELSYAEILEKLHNNTIEWEAFQSKTLLPTPSFEERVTLELPGILKQNFQKKTFLCSPGKKEGVEQEEICLVRIKIVFQPVGAGVKKERAFTYKAVVVRGGTAKNNALKKEGGVW